MERIERLRCAIREGIARHIYQPPSAEIERYRANIIESLLEIEGSRLEEGEELYFLMDYWGRDGVRIRIRPDEDGLEKSYIATVDKTGNVTLQLEGFFPSDGRYWSK